MKICTKKLCNNTQYCRKLCRKHYRELPEIKQKELLYREKYLRTKGHKKRVNRWNDSEKSKACTKKYSKTIKGRFSFAKSRSKRLDKNFTLDYEQYKKLLTKPCIYCNTTLQGETGIGLDRIDNKKGYEPMNVLPCCSECNKLRGDRLTVAETKRVISFIQKLRQRSNIWK